MNIFIANKRILVSGIIIGLPLAVLVLVVAGSQRWLHPGSLAQRVNPTVLGILSGPTITPTRTPTETPQPTPTAIPYTVSLVHAPEGLMEGDTATFTWDIAGPSILIPTTAIYYGTISTPGALTRNADPESTQYTGATADFLNGDYTVPMRFVANMPNVSPGRYYFRGYALIEGRHFWTEESTFEVRRAPRHEITIIDYPKMIAAGNNASFTWDIAGPAAETGFTAIVAGRQSRPGPLSAAVATTMTPYAVIVDDFIRGNANVPLRFVGDASLSEPGTYYFRAVAFINDKNIWSDEQTFTVQ